MRVGYRKMLPGVPRYTHSPPRAAARLPNDHQSRQTLTTIHTYAKTSQNGNPRRQPSGFGAFHMRPFQGLDNRLQCVTCLFDVYNPLRFDF
jgi:hypothetical protein